MLIRNILEESVRKFDEVKAVKWLKKKEIMERSYGELMENVVSTRKGLLAEGFEGKHIALIGTSSVEWMESYLGIITGCTTAVPLDAALPCEDLIDLLNRSDSAALFLSPKLRPYLDAFLGNCPKLQKVWMLQEEVEDAPAKVYGIGNLYISQPDTGEQGLEITETMVRSGAIDIIIVDSVAALVPKAEIDGDMGDSHVGLQARLMSQALRKLTGVVSKFNCTVIFINQLREKVGVMFGNPETTTGGRALKFYSSIRLDVRRTETLKQAGEMIGNRTRIKVVKNKVAPPFKQAEFDIMFGKGISKYGDILDLAADADIIHKSGAWYAYNGEKIGQGRENSKKYLEDHPDIAETVEHAIRVQYGLLEEDAENANNDPKAEAQVSEE